MSNVLEVRRDSDRDKLVTELRALADNLENGKVGARTLILIADDRDDGSLRHWIFGYQPRSSDLLGMLEFVKFAYWKCEHA